jgi:hypothetical protein
VERKACGKLYPEQASRKLDASGGLIWYMLEEKYR